MTGPGASLKTIRFSFAAAPALRENNTTRSYSNGYYPAYCLLYVHIRSNHWAKREDANAWKERVHWRLIITKCVREERPMLHTALLLFYSARFLSFTCRGKTISSSFSFSSSAYTFWAQSSKVREEGTAPSRERHFFIPMVILTLMLLPIWNNSVRTYIVSVRL